MRIVTSLTLFLFLLAPRGIAQDVMRVHFIDVGQGAATLIEFPCAAVLVDAGGEDNPEFHFNVGLMNYLETFFANRPDLDNRLDSIIITHSHNDHAQGAPAIRKAFTPRNVVINGHKRGGGVGEQKDLQDYALDTHDDGDPNNDVGLEIVTLDAIPVGTPLIYSFIDPANCTGVIPEIRLLWGRLPRRDREWSRSQRKNPNNNSIVVRVDYGDASLLITGDLERAVIDNLIRHYQGTGLLDVDVYLAGHHGSKNGTTGDMLDAMTPELAVISMGSADRRGSLTAWDHGHPNLGIVQKLEGAVSESRSPKQVQVFDGQETDPINHTVDRAIYATGWEGTIVMEADAQGNWSVAHAPMQDRININTATLAQLDSLPRIGRSRAGAIIEHRTANGDFQTVDDITDVRGIGSGILESIRSRITVN